MSSRRRRRRRRIHRSRMIGKMSSFRRRRRLPFPPQEPDAAAAQSPRRGFLQCDAVRIRRGYDESHLFLFSLSLSLSLSLCVCLFSCRRNTTPRENTKKRFVEILSLFLIFCVFLPKKNLGTFASHHTNNHVRSHIIKSFHRQEKRKKRILF